MFEATYSQNLAALVRLVDIDVAILFVKSARKLWQAVLVFTAMLLIKLIVLLLLVAILISLFSGLFFLVKDKGQTKRTVNALSIRIGLSILVIVVVLIGAATGVIEVNQNPMMNDVKTSQ